MTTASFRPRIGVEHLQNVGRYRRADGGHSTIAPQHSLPLPLPRSPNQTQRTHQFPNHPQHPHPHHSRSPHLHAPNPLRINNRHPDRLHQPNSPPYPHRWRRRQMHKHRPRPKNPFIPQLHPIEGVRPHLCSFLGWTSPEYYRPGYIHFPHTALFGG